MAPGTAKTDASAPQAAIADQKLSAGNEEGLLKSPGVTGTGDLGNCLVCGKGVFMTSKQRLVSISGQYSLIFKNGDLVLQERLSKSDFKPIWTSEPTNKEATDGVRLSVKDDGELILADINQKTRWTSVNRGNGIKDSVSKPASLILDDSGHLAASFNGKTIWTNPISGANKPVPDPNDNSSSKLPKPANVKIILRGGEPLAIDQRLLSSDGKYWLSLNSKGNFGVSTEEGFLWKATFDDLNNAKAPESVLLKKTGELVLLASDKKTEVWSSESGIKNATDGSLVMNDNGHAAITANGERLWYSYRPKDMSTNKDRLVAGEWLKPEQALESGKARLVLQDTGEIALFQDDIKLWSEQAVTTSVTSATRMILQPDDNLWIGSDNQPTWTSKSRRRKYGGKAVLRITTDIKDGPSAIIESGNITLWSSKKTFVPSWESLNLLPADLKSGRIRSGQYISLDQKIFSPDGKFYVVVQKDGIYIRRKEESVRFEWRFKPVSTVDIVKLYVGWDGNMVLGGKNTPILWQSYTANYIDESELVIYNDGDLVFRNLRLGFWSMFTAGSRQ